MALLKGFLGRDYEIADNCLYDGRNYWLSEERTGGEEQLVLGLTEPGVALLGAVIDFEIFPEPGDSLVVDEELAFATTKKNMKYFLSPLAGRVLEVNSAVTAGELNDAPLDTWLLKMAPEGDWRPRLLDAEKYAAKLSGTEHATPEASQAAKSGKSSPTCKSIYTGIKEG